MNRTIIPIASGKGGVGKSFITANLAIALAKLGKQVIVADLDFGGSNLHTCLGIHNTHPGIGDFLRARFASGLAYDHVPGTVCNLLFSGRAEVFLCTFWDLQLT